VGHDLLVIGIPAAIVAGCVQTALSVAWNI